MAGSWYAEPISKAIGYFIGFCSPPWSPVSMQRDLASKLGHPYPMDPCCRSAWMACGWPSMCALQHWSRYNRCCSGFEVDCTCWSSGPSTNTPNGQENSCKGAGLPFMVHWAMDIQYLLKLPTCVSSQGTKKHPSQDRKRALGLAKWQPRTWGLIPRIGSGFVHPCYKGINPTYPTNHNWGRWEMIYGWSTFLRSRGPQKWFEVYC